MKELPEKPSELIRVALADLEKCEDDPELVIDMGDWVVPTPLSGFSLCEVCLAGAVMVKSLDCDTGRRWTPHDLEPEGYRNSVSGKLFALNDFRMGAVHNGLRYCGIEDDDPRYKNVPPSFHVGSFEGNRTYFKRRLGKLADLLQEQKL